MRILLATLSTVNHHLSPPTCRIEVLFKSAVRNTASTRWRAWLPCLAAPHIAQRYRLNAFSCPQRTAGVPAPAGRQ